MLSPPRGMPLRIAAPAFQVKARRLNVAGSRPVSRPSSPFRAWRDTQPVRRGGGKAVVGPATTLSDAMLQPGASGTDRLSDAARVLQAGARSTGGGSMVRVRDRDDHEAIYPRKVIRIAGVEG